MSSRGQIERVSRGVYRLPYYPVSDVAQYIEAVLWPQGLVAVLSHESALLLHRLSDVSPAQIHNRPKRPPRASADPESSADSPR